MPGCPIAPVLAKLVMAPIIEAFVKEIKPYVVDVWIDDISIDLVCDSPEKLAHATIQAFRVLKNLLHQHGFSLSPNKTGIIVSDSKIARAIKVVRDVDTPEVHQVLKDLGVDSAGARLRRIPTQRSRQRKAERRTKQVKALKIPVQAYRVRLIRGSVHPSMLHGVEANGLPPARMRVLRLSLGRHIGLQKHGSLDVLFRFHEGRYEDPALTILLRQIKIMHMLIQTWPVNLEQWLEHAWSTTWQRLVQVQHAWKVVTGPQQTLQVMLLKMGWDAHELGVWHLELAGRAWSIRFVHDPLHATVATMRSAFIAHQWLKVSTLPGAVGLAHGGDFEPLRKFIGKKSCSQLHKNALMSVMQGTLRTMHNGGIAECPMCQEAATLEHVLWECQWFEHHGIAPVPENWKGHWRNAEESALWLRGILPTSILHPPNWEGDAAKEVVCEGKVPKETLLTVAQNQIFCVMSRFGALRDPRLRISAWSVGVFQVKHAVTTWQGSWSGRVQRQQTVTRGILTGLLHLLSNTVGVCIVLVDNSQFVNQWKSRRHTTNEDLWYQLSQMQGFSRLRLCPCKQTKGKEEFCKVNPPEEVWKWHCLNKVAQDLKTYVVQWHDADFTSKFVALNEKAQGVLQLLAQRVAALLSAKPGHHPMKPTKADTPQPRPSNKWRKGVGAGPKQQTLEHFLTLLPDDPDMAKHGHNWEIKKWTVKCALCGSYVRKRQSWKEVLAVVDRPCQGPKPQRKTKKGMPSLKSICADEIDQKTPQQGGRGKGTFQALHKGRQDFLTFLMTDSQNKQQEAGVHTLSLRQSTIACEKCGQSKRFFASTAELIKFHQSKCPANSQDIRGFFLRDDRSQDARGYELEP